MYLQLSICKSSWIAMSVSGVFSFYSSLLPCPSDYNCLTCIDFLSIWHTSSRSPFSTWASSTLFSGKCLQKPNWKIRRKSTFYLFSLFRVHSSMLFFLQSEHNCFLYFCPVFMLFVEGQVMLVVTLWIKVGTLITKFSSLNEECNW